ncbi:MAG: hypothetical protein NVV73_15065 [Cellvibrionaceae bacterium]|nr:hypothetical protein [Cellvibrionaceae bacterium]
MLFIKILLVSLMVGVIAISGRIWGAGVAGLLSGLPVIGGPILWFIYQAYGLDFARDTAAATVGGIAALSSFCLAYSWLCLRLQWYSSFLLACLLFLVVAFLIDALPLNLHGTAVLALAVLLFQLRLFPALSKQPLAAAAGATEILFRMGFAFFLVLFITHFAEILGPAYSGMLTVFPVAGSAIAVFSHRNHSPAHAIKSLKAMVVGLLSMLAFFYALAALSAMSFAVSMLAGVLAVLGVQAAVLLIKYAYQKSIRARNLVRSNGETSHAE